MEQLFNETNKRWLTGIIDARDQVNHGMAGGMKIERFAVFRDAAGTEIRDSITAGARSRRALIEATASK